MDVHLYVWLATIAGLLIVLVGGLILDHRNPHEVTMKEATRGIVIYVSLAVLFGLGVWWTSGLDYAGQFFAGYITEYSLSVDNLFVFVVIMSRFAVPRRSQHEVLLVGIVLALVLRGIFIAVGATVIAHFSWIFYIFGAFLIYTAIQMARHRDDDEEVKENFLLRLVQKRLPATNQYDGTKLVTYVDGKRLFTPMVIVMVAIGSTDLLFAVDSIPAIFGLTKEPYLVFTANMFALMGLRQLFFLIGGLLDRLIYLTLGLAVVLGFIGVKLLLEALHSSGLEWAPEVPVWLSLVVIVVVLAVTTVASLLKKKDPEPADDHS